MHSRRCKFPACGHACGLGTANNVVASSHISSKVGASSFCGNRTSQNLSIREVAVSNGCPGKVLPGPRPEHFTDVITAGCLKERLQRLGVYREEEDEETALDILICAMGPASGWMTPARGPQIEGIQDTGYSIQQMMTAHVQGIQHMMSAHVQCEL